MHTFIKQVRSRFDQNEGCQRGCTPLQVLGQRPWRGSHCPVNGQGLRVAALAGCGVAPTYKLFFLRNLLWKILLLEYISSDYPWLKPSSFIYEIKSTFNVYLIISNHKISNYVNTNMWFLMSGLIKSCSLDDYPHNLSYFENDYTIFQVDLEIFLTIPPKP